MNKIYPCEKCGICCTKLGKLKNTSLHEYYINYNDGNDICKFFDKDLKLCKDYNNRPVFCNGKELYLKYYKDIYSIDEFYAINQEKCKLLQKENNGKK